VLATFWMYFSCSACRCATAALCRSVMLQPR
jgi:hypothetical protein